MKYELKKSIKAMAKAGVLAGSLTGLSMLSQSVGAASGDVAVDISFPPLIILYYYDDIDITVDPTDFGSVVADSVVGCTGSSDGLSCVAGTSPLSISGSADSISGTTLTYTADIQGEFTGAEGNTTVSFELENVWAVRALIPAGQSLDASVVGTGTFGSLGIAPTAPAASLSFDNSGGASDNVGDLLFDVDLTTTGLTASDTLTITVVSL